MGRRRRIGFQLILTLLVSGLLSLAGPAFADPCEAIPEAGALPAYLGFGATFSGPVVDVIDGDSLCVAVGEGHENWVEVRLADFFAPESRDVGGVRAKAALERIALGRQAVCVAGLRTYDRIAARCRIDGQPIGDAMRQAGIVEGGHGMPRAISVRPASGHISAPIEVGPAPVSATAFRSCAAARAAGAAPMRRGEPGYNPNLDGDHDGIACEPPRRH